jgi:hypothetical protein
MTSVHSAPELHTIAASLFVLSRCCGHEMGAWLLSLLDSHAQFTSQRCLVLLQ